MTKFFKMGWSLDLDGSVPTEECNERRTKNIWNKKWALTGTIINTCCQLRTLITLSIDNLFDVVDRQHPIINACYQTPTFTGSSIHDPIPVVNQQVEILDMLSIYNEQYENCVLSIDDIDKVVNWQHCWCYRSTTLLFQNVLSIDNIFQFFNRQPHFCCQSTTYNLNYFSSIKNISNVLN